MSRNLSQFYWYHKKWGAFKLNPNKHFLARGTISKDFKIPKSVQTDNSNFPFNSSYIQTLEWTLSFIFQILIILFIPKQNKKGHKWLTFVLKNNSIWQDFLPVRSHAVVEKCIETRLVMPGL